MSSIETQVHKGNPYFTPKTEALIKIIDGFEELSVRQKNVLIRYGKAVAESLGIHRDNGLIKFSKRKLDSAFVKMLTVQEQAGEEFRISEILIQEAKRNVRLSLSEIPIGGSIVNTS